MPLLGREAKRFDTLRPSPPVALRPSGPSGPRSAVSPSTGSAPPGHALIVEPDDGRTAVLQAISAAAKSIDLTIYELSDPEVVGALSAAQARGATVRVLYNWYSFSPEEQKENVMPTIQSLTRDGVACRPAPRAFEVTHEKAFVVDGATAVIQSFNLTPEYFGTTRDFGIVSSVAAEVAEVGAVFEADWSGANVAPEVPSLVWSPVNARAKLMQLIGGAQHTLDVYFEEISDPGTLGAFVTAAQRGVKVRVIAAVLASEDSTNGNARGIATLTAGGVDAVCKSFPVSTPSGSVPLYIHAKAIVSDFGTPAAQAFIGSENLSCVSLDDNRECGILETEPTLLARLESTFASDWGQPSVPVPADADPLTPCPGDAASRSRTRIASRS